MFELKYHDWQEDSDVVWDGLDFLDHNQRHQAGKLNQGEVVHSPQGNLHIQEAINYMLSTHSLGLFSLN